MSGYRPRIKPGDQYRVKDSTGTDWSMMRDAVVTVRAVDRLGCGCTRLTVERPGPTGGPLAGPMCLTVRRCVFHAANPQPGEDKTEAEPLVAVTRGPGQ